MIAEPEIRGIESLHPTDESAALRPREWIAIAWLVVALRLLICVVVCTHGHLTMNQYARLYDGNSYIITARAMCGDRSEFNDYHGRVFPGFPALVALLHRTGLPFAEAAIGIDWISAAAAAVMAAVLFNDRRVGWAMVLLIPHYLMNSALAMSEAPLLAFTLAGGLLLRRNKERPFGATAARRIGGGMLLGVAGLIRPMACFAMAGFAFADIADRSTRLRRRIVGIILFAFSAAFIVLCGLILVRYWRGSALAGVRYAASSPNTYGQDLLTWPFHALLTVPIHRHVPAGRVIYIWAHVVVTLTACGVMLRRFLHRENGLDARDALAGPWLWLNTLFVLCVGSIWGFECFHRFTIPALPAMFWALRGILPRRMIGWTMVAVASTLVAVLTLLHDLPGQIP